MHIKFSICDDFDFYQFANKVLQNLSLVIKQFDIDTRKPTKILSVGKNLGKQAVKTIDSPVEGRKESIFQRRDCVTETGTSTLTVGLCDDNRP